ncbi:hypothetical protein J7E71_12835 [Mesobacillus foraminis]|uniref:hypothetical protein n=1 Tax=Mesobacillus foraminis TaxID=279826 RepID=UPI001BEA725E|nr:hypothetical protein [Mesobacillus foraminis]MBT2756835.1 hypothetical protein [Mesobacillus foraminis]
MNRMNFLLLGLFLTVGLVLTGCGSAEKESSNSPSETPKKAVTVEKEQDERFYFSAN